MPSPDPVTPAQKRKITRLARDLRDWAKNHGRDFPWRSPAADTYQQVVVEVLLQRTTATAVSGFFEQFISRYPGWSKLADAEPEQLQEMLKPLGLWRRRAQSLVGLARYASENAGNFPADPREHARVPAAGQYVSNAIMHFQHGKAAPLLDVNMARALERYVRPRRLADIRHDPWLQEAAHWLVRRDTRDVNWAVLDFAAVICRARSPRCGACPVSSGCNYFRAAS